MVKDSMLMVCLGWPHPAHYTPQYTFKGES